jgi:GTP-sensing pleiotropic transcriptional regulator CodY
MSTGVAAAVAAWIADADREDERLLVPEVLADEWGVSRRSVELALVKLEEAGVLVWHRKSRGGVRRPYWVVSVADRQMLVSEVAA